MNLSLFIAQLLALVYLAIGLGVLFQPTHYRRVIKDMEKSPALLYFGAFLALIIGFSLIAYHNIWELDWRVLITILGWLSLIKGFALFLFPQSVVAWSHQILLDKIGELGWVVIALTLSAFFGYFGFLS